MVSHWHLERHIYSKAQGTQGLASALLTSRGPRSSYFTFPRLSLPICQVDLVTTPSSLPQRAIQGGEGAVQGLKKGLDKIPFLAVIGEVRKYFGAQCCLHLSSWLRNYFRFPRLPCGVLKHSGFHG